MSEEENKDLKVFSDQANKDTLEKVRDIQNKMQEKTEKQIAALESKALDTFRDLRYMIWIMFILGVVLIVSSLLVSIFFKEKTLEVLGLGSLGIADWLALFFYKPMDRLQKANTDFSQQIMILKSWIISTNLQLYAMNIKKPETVIEAAKNITSSAIESTKAIETYIEK